MGIKHNCCKEVDFEWKEIVVIGDGKDKIKCKVCGRIFEEVKEERK